MTAITMIIKCKKKNNVKKKNQIEKACYIF